MPTTKVTSAMAKRRAVQFWHLWSGLMVAPVLLVLLLTGAIYLFDRELDQWWYQDAYRTVVTAQTAPHTLAEQQHWLRQQLPQWWLAYTALLILALLIVSVIQAVQALCRQCRARTTDLAN